MNQPVRPSSSSVQSSARPHRPASPPVRSVRSVEAKTNKQNKINQIKFSNSSGSILATVQKFLGLGNQPSSAPASTLGFSDHSDEINMTMGNEATSEGSSSPVSPLSSAGSAKYLLFLVVGVVLILGAFLFHVSSTSSFSILSLLLLAAGFGGLWFASNLRHLAQQKLLHRYRQACRHQVSLLTQVNNQLSQVLDGRYQEYLPVTSGVTGEIFTKINHLLNAYKVLQVNQTKHQTTFARQVDFNNVALQKILAKDQATIQSFARVATGFLEIEAPLKHLNSRTNAFISQHASLFKTDSQQSPAPVTGSPSAATSSASTTSLDFSKLSQELVDLQTIFQDFSLGLNSLGELNQRFAGFLTSFTQVVASTEVLAVQVDLHSSPTASVSKGGNKGGSDPLLKLVSQEIHRLFGKQNDLLAKGVSVKSEMHHLLAQEKHRLDTVVNDLEQILRWLNSFEEVWDDLRQFQGDSLEFGTLIQQLQPTIATNLTNLGNFTKESLALLESGSSQLAALHFDYTPDTTEIVDSGKEHDHVSSSSRKSE